MVWDGQSLEEELGVNSHHKCSFASKMGGGNKNLIYTYGSTSSSVT